MAIAKKQKFNVYGLETDVREFKTLQEEAEMAGTSRWKFFQDTIKAYKYVKGQGIAV